MKKLFNPFIYALLLLVLFPLSLFPRSIEVLNKNPVFAYDHGRDYLSVKHIVVDHKLTLIGEEVGGGAAGLGYLFQGPGYYYFLTIPFILFHGDPVGGVWLMLIFGLATIAFGFYFGFILWRLKGAFILAFLLAVSPQLISQSRFFWNPHMPTFFILLTFYFVYLFITQQKSRYLFFAAFFSGFIYNFELAISIPLCITLFFVTIFVLRDRFKKYIPLFGGFILAFLPMLLFETRHHFLGLRNFLQYLFVHKETQVTAMFIYLHGHDVWQSVLYNFVQTFPGNGIIPGVFLFIFLGILIGIALYGEKNKSLKTFLCYLLLLLPVNIFVFDMLRNNAYSYYFTDLNLAYGILFTYLLITFVLRKNYIFSTMLWIFALLLLLTAIKNSIQTSFADYSDYGGTAKLKGKVDAIDYIYHDAHGKPFSLFVFSPPIYTYPYDYLLWWHGLATYHYLPAMEKKGIFYLLIEVDRNKPWTYKGWEETVIKTGTIIYTKTLPSGFIVEKRIVN